MAAATPILQVRNLRKFFPITRGVFNKVVGQVRAVDDVSFDVREGETLGLVGESGCGKTTVGRALVGLTRPTGGTIRFPGAPDGAAGTMRRQVQFIFQDPYASLNPRWRVGDIIAEPIREHRLIEGKDAIDDRVGALLQQVGLSAADASKYPHQFSGGQRQRISIARALASEADFLVCDEPTSALDVSVQAQVLNIMRDLQKARQLTYLFISHNLAVVHHISDRVGVMYLGRIVELAPKKTLFAQPQHPYTQMLLDAIPDMHMSGRARTPVSGEVPNPLNPPSGCTFHPRCPKAQDRCRQERPLLRMMASGAQVACHLVQD